MPLWKFLHVLGAVLLLGNVIVTGLWAHWALGQRHQAVDRFATRAILQADLGCTLLGGTLLVVSGLSMVLGTHLPIAGTPWLQHGIEALAVSTGLWLAVLLPDQWRMARMAAQDDGPGLRRLYRRWAVLGWAATAVLVWGLYAMVAKA